MDAGAAVSGRPRRAGAPPARAAALGTVLASLLLLTGCSGDLRFGAEQPPQTAAAPTIDSATRRMMVKQTQLLLDRLGYQPGVADGVEGPRTRAAIRHFQADYGYSANGRISEDLVEHLEVTLEVEAPHPVADKPVGKALPEYTPGNAYVYTDGRVETVVAAEGEKIDWRTKDGATFTSYRNFALPWASWQSASGNGRRTLNVDPAALWPLAPGNEITFLAETMVAESTRYQAAGLSKESWRCTVGDKERVSVVAGSFMTVKVVCERSIPGPSPRLTRVWFYAPSIGHYVRFDDYYDAMELDRHVELVAVRPGSTGWPPVARAGLGWALQHALEEGASGEETVWTSSAVEAQVTIRPIAKFTRGDGKTCRTYLQTWSQSAGRQRYPGTACRDSSGMWLIPGLDDNADVIDFATGKLS